MLSISNLTYRISGRTLLDEANLTIPAGHRVGLIGPNGTGKSTLFKLIVGELETDAGFINLPKNCKVGRLKQDLPDDDTKLIDVVLAADKERTSLLLEAETAEDPERICDIYARLDDIDAYGAPSRAATILSGLGFDEASQQRAIKDFSGGWRMRVALAASLFEEPDLLMLDEPTNHLDFEALIWLEGFLAKYKNTLLIISHDREMLNKVVDHIVHLDNMKLVSYTGNYDNFERLRAEKLMNQQALFTKQQNAKNKMMEFVNRFRAKASKAKQAQSRLKAIEKMDFVDQVITERAASFTFPEPEELPSPLITVDKVSIGYEKNKAILSNLNFRIDMDDRIALLGANGNGKSTLMKFLSQRLYPLSGDFNCSSKMRVGYFAQHQAEELDLNSTAFNLLRDSMQGVMESKIRAVLGQFGFNKAKADTKIEDLSGGEKARLLFALMSYNAPHIILLDEPTNHLDIEARQALIQALNNYSGAVIIVSHDPHLLECVADSLWLVEDGNCKPYDGDLDDYKNYVMLQKRANKSNNRNNKESKVSNIKNTSNSKIAKEMGELERKIEQLSVQKNKLIEEISKYFSNSDYKFNIKQLEEELKLITEDLIKAEERWIELQE